MIQGSDQAAEAATGREGWRDHDDHMLVVSRRSWLVSSLAEILDGIEMGVVRARSVDEALESVRARKPTIVLVDHGVEADEGDGPELCRVLAREYLSPSVPIVMYTSSAFARADLHTEALEAGAWTILHEPLEAPPLLALIRRLLDVGRKISRARVPDDLVDPETGLLTLSGLRRVLPSLGALAVRNQVPVSFVVVGPTGLNGEPASRRRTAAICSPNIRSADVCAWMDGDELAIVAYDTPAEGARRLVSRLNEIAASVDRDDGGVGELSAGIVELRPREGLQDAVDGSRRAADEGGDGSALSEFRDMFSLSAAQSALEEARKAGGGVQVVNVA